MAAKSNITPVRQRTPFRPFRAFRVPKQKPLPEGTWPTNAEIDTLLHDLQQKLAAA